MLFLDEPTLGLDVTMQKRIRSFIAEYNRRYGATVLLTSHYMADVQALCKRVIVIHHGRMLFDGALAELATRFNATKTIGVLLRDGDRSDRPVGLRRGHGVRRRAVLLRVPRADAAEVATRLLRDLPVADLTIEDPPIDDVIERVFATGRRKEPRTSRARLLALAMTAVAQPSPAPPKGSGPASAPGTTSTRRRCGSPSSPSSSTGSRTTST